MLTELTWPANAIKAAGGSGARAGWVAGAVVSGGQTT